MTDSVPESSWTGLLADGREEPDALGLRLLVRPSDRGLAGSFLALGIDRRRWWVKPPHQGEMDFALVTEYVVGKVGKLISAPTCENSIVKIDAAIEERPNLKYRGEDDNRARQAGIFALHDWCWGSDTSGCIRPSTRTASTRMIMASISRLGPGGGRPRRCEVAWTTRTCSTKLQTA